MPVEQPSLIRAPKTISELNIKLFADGADRAGILKMAARPHIKGFTTNPTLMKKAGITDYKAFALDILKEIKDRSISFEVFSDEFDEMEKQAREIASWAKNVHVKIPITNTRRESSLPLIKKLSSQGLPLNITALMSLEQVKGVAQSIDGSPSVIVSVFAGRIADTGRDPMPLMEAALELLKDRPQAELLWASPRELLNIFQADQIGCHIITATNDILEKLALVGKDLEDYSLETVKMFYNDAKAAGFSIPS